MGKTISFVKGKGSISHNNRDFITKNVDRERMAWNEYYVQQPIREAYQQIFGSAIAEYNAKQKRKDRQVTDYLTDIKNSGNKEKQFYEIVVQIGRMEDTGVLDANGELSVAARDAKEILDEYARSFQERNPNLYLFNAVLHMDEATPHLHLDYIPVAHGYKTKMHTRNSLTKALREMGIEPAVSKNDTETMHWQQREREYLIEMCRERGLEVEVLGEKRDNYTIPEYKAARQAADALTAELEILHAEKEEAENVISSIDTKVSGAMELLEESNQQLAEINEQIESCEKRYAAYESKLDMYKEAEKTIKRELATIKEHAKVIPTILGGEASVRLLDSDYKRLLAMAQTAGILGKLNEIYEKELTQKQNLINKLSGQIKTLKEKLAGFEGFLELRGLLEECKEFIRPKTIAEKLVKNKRDIAKRDMKTMTRNSLAKRHDDIAI
ncbi:MAG: plasmid recombination protein [Lachnospiraceae bacterium]|nr:plasmid recombination protein [Lachnospiraceae bacterium]